MLNLKLLSLFVKDCDNTSNPAVREKCASAAGIVGICSNIFLSVLKITIGIITKSISITADAVNNFTDAASSVITIIGFRLASKPADAEHPYGHRRIEYITGLIISMVITILGVQFLINSIQSLFNPSDTEFSLAALVILVVSIFVKLWQSRFYITVSKHIDSSTLAAAAADSRNDVVATSAVLIGAAISYFTNLNLDGYLGIAVACFIIKSGISLIIETSDPLLGIAPSAELIKSIGDRIKSYDGVLGYHDLVIHNYGPDRCFVSVHAEVPAEQDILVSHDIIDNIEFDFLRETGMHVVIHLDPVVTSDPTLINLRDEIGEIISQISKEIGTTITFHDFRMVKGQTHTNLLFDIAVPFECKVTDKSIEQLIDMKVKERHPIYNTVITCDRVYASAENH